MPTPVRSDTSRTRRWLGLPAALLAALALVLTGLAATPAQAAPGVSHTYGSVYDQGWNWIDPVAVSAFDVDPRTNPEVTPIATATTSNGSFTIEPAAAPGGSWVWLRFEKDGFLTTVQSYWMWGDSSYGIGAVLLSEDPATLGTLTGTVREPSGETVGGDRGHVEIHALSDEYDGTGDRWDHESYVKTVHTDDDGAWTTTLRAGRYVVEISDDEEELWGGWIGGTDIQSATIFAVTAQQTTRTPDFRLTEGARISGTVKDRAGKPVRDVVVTATDESGEESETWGWAQTDAQGRYTLRNLPDGEYKVAANDELGDYRTQWYSGAETSAAATPVRTASGAGATGIDFSLAAVEAEDEPSQVSGKVVDATGAPQRGSVVVALRKDDGEWSDVTYARVRANGTYSFPALPADQYIFWFDDGTEERRTEGEYYGDAYTENSAKKVDVSDAAPVALGTTVVTRYATVTGTVALEKEAGFTSSERDVYFVSPAGDDPGEDSVYVDMDSKGRYTAKLLPGTYLVAFRGVRFDSATEDDLEYIQQFWRNAYTVTTATTLTVGDGATLSGISATLGHRLKAVAAPRISGTATTGKKLTASPGTWNRSSDVLFGYQWKVGGAVVGTGTSYQVRAQDRGKPITVTVTGTEKRERYAPGSATSAAVTAKEVAKVSVGATGRKKSAKVTVSLTLPGTSAAATSGTVRVYDGRKLVRTLKVSKGKATATLKLKKGKHTLKAVYAGSTAYTTAQATRTVKVK